MKTSINPSFIFIFASILLTAYMQLVLKWQSRHLTALPETLSEQIIFFIHFALNPWIISTFVAALLSMISWSIGISRLPITVAYPFVGITFVIVLLGGVLIFQETIHTKQLIGIALIVIGIILVGQR